jgi:hypothetical protein
LWHVSSRSFRCSRKVEGELAVKVVAVKVVKAGKPAAVYWVRSARSARKS